MKNLYNSDGEIISIFFNFLESLKEKEYLPFDEIINLIEEIPFYNDKTLAKIFIENLEKLLENNKNKYDNEINTLSLSDNITEEKEKENNDDNFIEFKYNIYESYLN